LRCRRVPAEGIEQGAPAVAVPKEEHASRGHEAGDAVWNGDAVNRAIREAEGGTITL
jgi:hypothetical protein